MATAGPSMLVMVGLALSGCTFDPTDWELLVLNSTRIDPPTAGGRGDAPWPLRGDPVLGNGLTTRLAVSLQRHESNLYTAPDNLRVVVDHEDRLDVAILGEVTVVGSSLEYHSVELSLTPTAVGSNSVRLVSDSTDEVKTLRLDVREPSFDSFVVWTDWGEGGSSSFQLAETSVYGGSELIVWDRYLAGSQPVLGTRPLRVVGGDGQTAYEDGHLRVGEAPHDVALAVDGYDAALSVYAVGLDAVSALRAEVPGGAKTTRDDGTVVTTYYGTYGTIRFDGATVTAEEGARWTMWVWALDGAGRAVLGAAPEPFAAEVAGEAVALRNTEPVPALTFQRSVGIVAERLGSATIEIVHPGGPTLTLPVEVVSEL